MAELSKFFVTIGSKFDDKGFKKTTEAIRDVAVAGAAMGTALIYAGIKVTDSASRMQETTAKFNTVFRGLEKTANEWSLNLVKNYGVSTEQSKRFLSSIQDLLVPMGMARGEAGKLSNEIVI